jgi:hypothetical protein
MEVEKQNSKAPLAKRHIQLSPSGKLLTDSYIGLGKSWKNSSCFSAHMVSKGREENIYG